MVILIWTCEAIHENGMEMNCFCSDRLVGPATKRIARLYVNTPLQYYQKIDHFVSLLKLLSPTQEDSRLVYKNLGSLIFPLAFTFIMQYSRVWQVSSYFVDLSIDKKRPINHMLSLCKWHDDDATVTVNYTSSLATGLLIVCVFILLLINNIVFRLFGSILRLVRFSQNGFSSCEVLTATSARAALACC